MPARWHTVPALPRLFQLLEMGSTLPRVVCYALAVLLLMGIAVEKESVNCSTYVGGSSNGVQRPTRPLQPQPAGDASYLLHHQEQQRYRLSRSLLQANSSGAPAPLELLLDTVSDLSTDAQALLAFKAAIQGDPLRRLAAWGSPSDNPCSWDGVLCSLVRPASASASTWRVTSLDLAGANLVGSLPPSTFSSLPALVNLSLAVNFFHGNLSSFDGIVLNSSSSSLPTPRCNLKSVDLSSNFFDGPVPSAIFTAGCLELTYLNLSHNNLSGGIPSDAIPLLLQVVDLSNNSLSGEIPLGLFPSPDGLSYLQVLDLSCNDLTGPMPQELFNNCTTLQVLNLSGNRLTGPIPAGIGKCTELLYLNVSGNYLSEEPRRETLVSCSVSGGGCAVGAPNLRVLDLSRNNLTGSLAFVETCPRSLSILSLAGNHLSGVFSLASYFNGCLALEELDVSSNSLSELSLTSVAGLPKLRILRISDNQLSGSLPPGLGALLPTVQDLDLSSNQFVGALPSSLANMTSLVSLRATRNNLTGELPTNLIYTLCEANLLVLDLGFNNFTGVVPDGFLSRCSRLKVLDLSANRMNGEIPADFCPTNMSVALEILAIPNNNISGTIPPGLSRCVQLKTLDLSFNMVNGEIPEELGSLAFMEYLFLWSNQLSGEIPPSLGNCTRLKGLILNYNRLTGKIPPELSKCSNLLWLSLNTNYLEGPIPAEMGRMQKLALLQLGNNSFMGPLPRELANCTGLIWLDVNSNELSGPIPSPIGRREVRSSINPELENFSFAFVKNIGPNCQGIGGLMEFSGIRITEITTSPRLISCNFTRLFSGFDGNNFYNWRSDSSIEYLDMSFNQLTGPIPDDFGNMGDLHVLNLAHNRLSGPLPAALGNSKQLESLILSHNMLTGPIPASFGHLTFLSYLDLSNNNLSGPIPSGGQLATFPPSVYENNPGLCGMPLEDSLCSDGDGPAGAGEWGGGKRREPLAPWATSLLLAFLISVGLLVVTAVWWVWTGRRLPWKWWKWNKASEGHHRGSLECGHDRIPSWNGASDWKSGYGREPLSINVATFERPLRRLTFAHLLEATNQFSEESIIGAGGFGEVYKAELPDGGTVAVKKLIHSSFQGDREFTAEMETLGKIKHHNLVPLLGYCKVGEERLLVYEFMACGSLEHILHDRGGPPALALPLPLAKERPPKKVGNSGLLTPPLRIEFDWELRRQVAMGAARGLAFLHHNCIPHIIHRDMKSSNVLLDSHLVARVSDFGMARLISASDTHLSVSTLAGTPGYVPPEYYQSFRCTTKGDVYSFGVVLLELLTGKRPTNKDEFGDSNLVGWVKLLLAQKRSCNVLDPDLRGNGMEHDMLQHLRIACMCVEDVPSHRPTMVQVVAMFKELHLDTSQITAI